MESLINVCNLLIANLDLIETKGQTNLARLFNAIDQVKFLRDELAKRATDEQQEAINVENPS